MKQAKGIPLSDYIPDPKNGPPFGWISPEGIVFITQSMEHIAYLENVPELQSAWLEYQSEIDCNAEYMDSELEWAAENDEHPAMHRFDGIDDDARDKMYKAAYDLGWVRFGFTMDIHSLLAKKSVLSQFEVYGSKDGVDKIFKLTNKLAKELNLFFRAYRIKPPRKRSYATVFEYDVEEHNYWR